MRVLLLTDSLGCPREEIEVKDTWTDKVLSEFSSSGITFYTWCHYGLSSSDIPKDYIGYLKPDIIICQVGIVDACRRALKVEEQKKIVKIPILRKIVWDLCRINHFVLTKIRDIHRVDKDDFGKAFDDLLKLAINRMAIIEIAPPGNFLINKTYNVKEDVVSYNEIIYGKANNEKVDILKPFSNYGLEKCDEYLLESDGHHLNTKGHILVYKAVKKYILNQGI